VKQPFERVVTEHGPTVLRVCRALLGPVDADDAWSETFIAALRAYPDLPADANVEAWLVTIAHRKAIDAYRAAARRPVAVREVPELEPVPPPAEGHEVWDALKALPDKQRAAVAYHHVAGLPHKEVAAILGGTPEAARRAAADGIAALRRNLARPEEPAAGGSSAGGGSAGGSRAGGSRAGGSRAGGSRASESRGDGSGAGSRRVGGGVGGGVGRGRAGDGRVVGKGADDE
jgi:RNA polymerase sigma factor (sigma-70 family)